MNQPSRSVLLGTVGGEYFSTFLRTLAHQVLVLSIMTMMMRLALEHHVAWLDEMNLPNFPCLAIVTRTDGTVFTARNVFRRRSLGGQKETSKVIGCLQIPVAGVSVPTGVGCHQIVALHRQQPLVMHRSNPDTTVGVFLDRPTLPRAVPVFRCIDVT